MISTISDYKKELFREIEGMPDDKIKEIIDFACFIKVKDVLDHSQTYFWTTKWQEMEREADSDKKAGILIGDGTLENLLNELNK